MTGYPYEQWSNSLRPLKNILRRWAAGGIPEVPLIFKPAIIIDLSTVPLFLARPLLEQPPNLIPGGHTDP